MKKERGALITREGSEDEQVVNVEREAPSEATEVIIIL